MWIFVVSLIIHHSYICYSFLYESLLFNSPILSLPIMAHHCFLLLLYVCIISNRFHLIIYQPFAQYIVDYLSIRFHLHYILILRLDNLRDFDIYSQSLTLIFVNPLLFYFPRVLVLHNHIFVFITINLYAINI